jgi:hypothetical protein
LKPTIDGSLLQPVNASPGRSLENLAKDTVRVLLKIDKYITRQLTRLNDKRTNANYLGNYADKIVGKIVTELSKAPHVDLPAANSTQAVAPASGQLDGARLSRFAKLTDFQKRLRNQLKSVDLKTDELVAFVRQEFEIIIPFIKSQLTSWQ